MRRREKRAKCVCPPPLPLLLSLNLSWIWKTEGGRERRLHSGVAATHNGVLNRRRRRRRLSCITRFDGEEERERGKASAYGDRRYLRRAQKK